MKYQTDIVDIHIHHSCNLACAGCNHFSDLTNDEERKDKNFLDDLNKVTKKVRITKQLSILGGEPLYRKNFKELFISALRVLQKNNFNLGGEQSGHIILGKFATTGDGLLVALEVLFAIRKGEKASSFFNKFKKTPQILENVIVKDKSIINNSEVKKSIKKAEKLMNGHGRILVRASGTESKIRVMGESENRKLLEKCLNIILTKLK